jgi:hypothetical protein
LGLRQTLNENRSVTVGAAVGITVLAVLWIVWFSMTGGDIPASPPANAPVLPTSQSS